MPYIYIYIYIIYIYNIRLLYQKIIDDDAQSSSRRELYRLPEEYTAQHRPLCVRLATEDGRGYRTGWRRRNQLAVAKPGVAKTRRRKIFNIFVK